MREWLDGVEPAWTLLTFESLQALRHEASSAQTAIRIGNDLTVGEIAGSPVARNTLILLRQAIERGGLALTATGNLSRAMVAEICKLIEWPDYDQADAFRFNKVINEPDFLPLHVVRQLAQAATLVRAQRGKLVATPLGKSMLSDARQGSILAILFHLAFWHMDLGYFGRGLIGSWPQPDAGVVLWSLSVCADEWQSAEKLTRLCTIPEPAMFSGTWDKDALRDGGQDPPTAALVWITRTPQRKASEQPVRRAPFLSQDGVVRTIACFRRPGRPVGRGPALKAAASAALRLRIGGELNLFERAIFNFGALEPRDLGLLALVIALSSIAVTLISIERDAILP